MTWLEQPVAEQQLPQSRVITNNAKTSAPGIAKVRSTRAIGKSMCKRAVAVIAKVAHDRITTMPSRPTVRKWMVAAACKTPFPSKL